MKSVLALALLGAAQAHYGQLQLARAVTSDQIRCYQLAAAVAGSSGGAQTMDDAGGRAGDTVGDGAAWFKIAQDAPAFGEQAQRGARAGRPASPTATTCCASSTSRCTARRSAEGGAQFYQACAQLHVSGGGGGGSETTFPGVAIPGAYSATDPGILYNPIPTNYTAPGPAVVSC
ncbi:glycoside hydrolase family 61 protein [Biscogniauxia mediterranea]|nr:glycoside hydrolase family 61 protein [Biscogniauxia mediterranea]